MKGKSLRTLSLRGALIVFTFACVVSAWLGNSLRQQAQLIAKIRASGGSVTFMSDLAPAQRKSALATIFGEEAAGTVAYISLRPETPAALRQQAQRRGWQNIPIYPDPSDGPTAPSS